MHRRTLLAAAAALAVTPAAAQTGISLVAAENMYGDIARQLAGPEVGVTSILSNPDADPHLFEASPAVARALSQAAIVIVNGADYDPWMDKLLGAAQSAHRRVITVAALAGRKSGDNPHLWYDTKAIAALARAVSATLVAANPADQVGQQTRLQAFLASLAALDARIASLRARVAGQSVTATEPVFGYMASALGLVMRNERFQIAVMNDTEPAASDVAAFETDLRRHRVRVLLYNSQASDPAAQRLLAIAHEAKVPVVGVTETMPAGQTYQSWMSAQLDTLAAAMISS